MFDAGGWGVAETPPVDDCIAGFLDVIALNLWGDREVTDLAGKAMPEKEFAKAMKVQLTDSSLRTQ